jgi:hypothetical protein
MKMTKKIRIVCVVVAVVLATAWWLWWPNVRILLRSETYGYASSNTAALWHGLVSPSLHNILLIRSDASDSASAIRYDRMTPDRGVDYTSWVCDQRKIAPLSDIPKAEGHAFCRYWVTRLTPSQGKAIFTGDLSINCGTQRFQWKPGSGIYIPTDYYIAVVSNDVTTPLDFNSEHLVWYKSPFVPNTQSWHERSKRKIPMFKKVDIQQPDAAVQPEGAPSG